MLGLAQMCWLAAVYRKSALSWERAVDFATNITPAPVPRYLCARHDGCFKISHEYYRIIDGIAAQLGQ